MGKTDNLLHLASGADVLVIALPMSKDKSISIENIGRLAQSSGVRKLILTNLSATSSDSENSTRKAIGKLYKGEILFAEDLECIPL